MARNLLRAKKEIYIPFILCFFVFVFYISFLSKNYDLNGIYDVQAAERGDFSGFSPHHFVFNMIGTSFYKAWLMFGYKEGAIIPLQILTAFFGSLSVLLLYLILLKLLKDWKISLLISAGFTISGGLWRFSTDVQYISLALFTILLSLYISLFPKKILLVSFISAIAVFSYKANIFLIPAVIFILYLTNNKRVKKIAEYLIYLGAIFFLGYWSLGFKYMLNYGKDLAMWGNLAWLRIPRAILSFIGTFTRFKSQSNPKELIFTGRFDLDQIVPQLCFILTLILLLLVTLYLIKLLKNKQTRNIAFSLVLWVLPLSIFNMWWDPFPVKFFIIPSVGVWILFAIFMKDTKKNVLRQAILILFIIYFLMLFFTNFTLSIYPNSKEENNINLKKASMFSEIMEENDLIIDYTFRWPQHLPYFFQKEAFNIMAKCESRECALKLIEEKINLVRKKGGRAFIADYNLEDWAKITENAHIKKEDLLKYNLKPVLTFWDNETVYEIQ